MKEKSVAQASWPVHECAGWKACTTILHISFHVLMKTTKTENPYVTRSYTHYYNRDLPKKNYFRRSRQGHLSQIEGGYADGKATTKFDVVTTAITPTHRDAAIADLTENLANKY